MNQSVSFRYISIVFFILCIIFESCQKNEISERNNDMYKSRTKEIRYAEIIDNLKKINNQYSTSTPQSKLHNKTKAKDIWDATVRVAKADGDGALDGGGKGAVAGTVIGGGAAAIPTFGVGFLEGAGAGAIVGTLVGAIVGSVEGSVMQIVEEADDNDASNNNGGQGTLATLSIEDVDINLNLYPGTKIGYLHNNIIQTIIEDSLITELNGFEDFYDYVCDYLEDNELIIWDTEDRDDLESYLYDNVLFSSIILDDDIYNIDFIETVYNTYCQVFFNLNDDNYALQYTREYISYLSENLISEVIYYNDIESYFNMFIINSSISVLYSSYNGWVINDDNE